MKKRLRKKLKKKNKVCSVCNGKIDVSGLYGVNSVYEYWCNDCVNY